MGFGRLGDFCGTGGAAAGCNDEDRSAGESGRGISFGVLVSDFNLRGIILAGKMNNNFVAYLATCRAFVRLILFLSTVIRWVTTVTIEMQAPETGWSTVSDPIDI